MARLSFFPSKHQTPQTLQHTRAPHLHHLLCAQNITSPAKAAIAKAEKARLRDLKKQQAEQLAQVREQQNSKIAQVRFTIEIKTVHSFIHVVVLILHSSPTLGILLIQSRDLTAIAHVRAQETKSGKWKFLLAQTEVFAHFLAGTKAKNLENNKGKK